MEAAFERIPEALLVISEDGLVNYGNTLAATILGVSSDAIKGVEVKTLLVADQGPAFDPVKWLARWAEIPDAEQQTHLHLSGTSSGGKHVRLSLRVALIASESPEQARQYIVTFRDISQSRKQQLETRHAYLVAARILAVAEDAVITVDKDHRVSFFNDKAETLLGYTREEMLGQPLELLLHESARKTHKHHIDSFQLSKEPSRLMGQRGEIIALTKQGDQIPLEATITKVFIEGEPTFCAHLRDIRQRKKQEVKLAASEQRFRTIFENTVEAVALLNLEGKVLEINSAARSMLGSTQDVNNQYFWELPWWSTKVTASELTENRVNMKAQVEACVRGEVVRVQDHLVGVDQVSRYIDFSLIRAGDVIIAEGRSLEKW